MTVTVYAPGLTVEVFDKAGTPTGGTGGTGSTGSTGSTGGTSTPPSVVINKKTVDFAKSICAPGFFNGGQAYDRFQKALVLTGPATLRAITHDGNAFGAALNLSLTFDGAAVATATTVPTANAVDFVLTQAAWNALADGNYLVSITGATGWDILDFAARVNKGGNPATMVVVSGSYEVYNTGWSGPPRRHHSVRVPAVFAPVTQPLPVRTYPAFTTTTGRQDLALTQLSVFRPVDVYRTQKMANGILTPCNRQNYDYGAMEEPQPQWPLLDGPRGRGGVIGATSLRESVRPDGNAKVYFTDPWRFAKVEEDGTITTLAGYRHQQPPPYWEEHPTPDLVGDWSAIPVARRQFRELWDFVWDPDTLTLNPTAPPIGGEQPHNVGPTAYLAATNTRGGLGTGTLYKVVFSPTDRTVPAKVTEAITGLNSPWGCEIVGNLLFVSQRTGNVVSVYDKTTLAPVRSYAITQPEGIRAQDGFLYVGSRPGACIWKVNLTTHAITKHCDILVDGNSRFVNIGISDGTAWARGTIGVVTWSNNKRGFPRLHAPNGVEFDWLQSNGGVQKGPPGPDVWSPNEHPMSYPSAVSLGAGRMTWGGVEEGLFRVSKVLPTDTALPPLYAAGALQWEAGGYRLAYGDYGFGFYGLPPPWGDSPEIDAYLIGSGHVRQ